MRRRGLAMGTTVKYAARLDHVREVTLQGEAELAFWGGRLREHDMVPVEEDGKAQILIIAADAKFAGVRFREVSVSVAVSRPEGAARKDAVFLVQAFNSSRFFAFCERAVFKTPYQHGRTRVSASYPPSIQVRLGGEVVLQAGMGLDPSGTAREPSRAGEDGWEGPVFLPEGRRGSGQPGRLFFARIGGQTRVYPFREGHDTVTIRASPGGPTVFRDLVDSRFTGKTWIVRENAEHAKSKTYRRADLFPGPARA